jgi:hypothetical protein
MCLGRWLPRELLAIRPEADSHVQAVCVARLLQTYDREALPPLRGGGENIAAALAAACSSAVPDGQCGGRGENARFDRFRYAVLKASEVINQGDGSDLGDRFVAIWPGQMPEEDAGVPLNHRH